MKCDIDIRKDFHANSSFLATPCPTTSSITNPEIVNNDDDDKDDKDDDKDDDEDDDELIDDEAKNANDDNSDVDDSTTTNPTTGRSRRPSRQRNTPRAAQPIDRLEAQKRRPRSGK
jgi:hypothetical protein